MEVLGRPKTALVLDAEQREQVESLADAGSGRSGESGQDCFVERFWEDELGDCAATGDDQRYGRQVAAALPRTGYRGSARRVTPRPPAAHQRRACGAISTQDAEDQTRAPDALEYKVRET